MSSSHDQITADDASTPSTELQPDEARGGADSLPPMSAPAPGTADADGRRRESAPSDPSSPPSSSSRRRQKRPSSPILEEPEAEEMHDQLSRQRRRLSPPLSATAPRSSYTDEPMQGDAVASSSQRSGAPASDPARKRPRREDPDAKKRGARMFGLLNSTLTKFKTDAEKQKTSDAARRRASLEARLQERLKRESHEITLKQELEAELRSYVVEARRLAETIALRESEHRTRRAQKRRMASFLWTVGLVESDIGHPRSRTGAGSRGVGGSRRDRDRGGPRETEPHRIAPHIPFTLAPISRAANEEGDYPLYYLPYKLLPSQDDVLDEQEAKVDDEIDQADEEWDKERDKLEEKLSALKDRMKKKRDEVLEESSRKKKVAVKEEDEMDVEDEKSAGGPRAEAAD